MYEKLLSLGSTSKLFFKTCINLLCLIIQRGRVVMALADMSAEFFLLTCFLSWGLWPVPADVMRALCFLHNIPPWHQLLHSGKGILTKNEGFFSGRTIKVRVPSPSRPSGFKFFSFIFAFD